MAFVRWDEGIERVFHGQLPQHSPDQGQVVQAFDINKLRGGVAGDFIDSS
jgi:hypothetical protein